MVKQHTIKLTIKNSTVFPMHFHSHWFDSGRVADHFSFPALINKNEKHTIVCYERNWAVSGCSGYVQYNVNGNLVTIAFSNPSVGSNKVGVGMEGNGKEVWDRIASHDYQDFQVDIKCGGVPMIAHCKCTGGTTNDATVTFHVPFSIQQQHQQNFACPPPYH